MTLQDKFVMCSGKIRTAALDALQGKVDLHTWQQGGRMPKEQFDEWLAQAEALYSTGNIRIDEALLAKAPKLKVIAQASVGYDNIDVAACAKRGIPVGNTPGVLVNAVADLAYALLLDTARSIVRGNEHVASGKWGERKPLGLGVDLYGKTLGIVGLGDIGTAIAMRAQVSGMRVIYHNRNRRTDEAVFKTSYASFEDLLQQADFIMVAVNLNPSTLNMFDDKAFAKMKDGVRFINISRGKVVDTEALVRALESGKVAAAALDVTEPEPLPGNHPLAQNPKVTITPHIASATVETRDAMAVLTAENILSAIAGKAMPARVVVK